MTASVETGLSRLILGQHPYAAAQLLEDSAPEEVAELLNPEAAGVVARVVMALTPDLGAAVLTKLVPAKSIETLEAMEPNRASVVLAQMEPSDQAPLLAGVSPSTAREFRALQAYSSDTAGGMMNPRVVAFRPDDTVGDVIRVLRSRERRRIQDVFMVDDEGRLVGAIPIQEIVLSNKSDLLRSLPSESRSVAAITPREEVVEQLRQQPSGSLGVVDFEGRLVGVLRQAELLGAAQRAVAANALTMVGASKDERALSPFTFSVRKRLPWLLVNLLTAFLASFVVGLFESTIARFTALAVLLPVVAGQSGNTGAQALAVTMRGLALREVRTHHWFRVAVKEVAAGASNGVAIALTTGAAVWWWSQSSGLGLVIASAMILSMTTAGLAGALIPMILTSLRQDPAQSSSIVLTTVTDVAGFLSFLGIATILAGIL